jgi:hypothetical protein
MAACWSPRGSVTAARPRFRPAWGGAAPTDPARPRTCALGASGTRRALRRWARRFRDIHEVGQARTRLSNLRLRRASGCAPTMGAPPRCRSHQPVRRASPRFAFEPARPASMSMTSPQEHHR